MKMFYRKKYLDLIKKYLTKDKLVLLVWPRQVWKTTIMKQLFDEIEEKNKLFLNLEEINEIPESLKKFSEFLKFEYWFDLSSFWYLFLDEIQVLQNPETFIKVLYDSDDVKVKLIVSWSRFWWQKKVWSSLVWRWYLLNIWPFDFEEFLEIKWKKLMNVSWDLIKDYVEEYLIFWWYPKVVFWKTKQEKLEELEKIVERYFERDFLYFFERWELFDIKKVFQYLSLNLKNIVKYDTIATEFWISRYKVKNFIKFLEDSFLIWRLPPFFTDKSKEFSSHNKYYFVDNWLLNYIRWNFDITLDRWWIVENFVFTHLKRIVKEIYYYHKQKWWEIDFIVSQFDSNLKRKIMPVEVKSGNRIVVPKIFYSFYDSYKDLVDKFVVTTKDFEDEKVVNWFKVNFVKFWYFWKEITE